MDDRADAELRALRARAYGPDADLSRDPAAAQRWAELEERARAERMPPPRARADEPERPVDEVAEPDPEASAAETSGAEMSTADTDATEGATTAGEAEPEASVTERPPRRTRLILTWAASLVVVAALAVSITALATLRTAVGMTTTEDSGATHVTTLLAQREDGRVPAFFGDSAEDIPVYDDFLGLRVIAMPDQWAFRTGPDTASQCIFVASAEALEESTNSGGISGPFYSGCSAGAFPAAVQFVVTPDAPAPLRERYPEGSGVQFVLHDDGIDVFVAPPAPGDETPEP